MNAGDAARLLQHRVQLANRDRWSPRQLRDHQTLALAALRSHVYARSPFYQKFHRGLTDRPLEELPVLTKTALMENFDQLVTNPAIRRRDVEQYLTRTGGRERYLGRFSSTSWKRALHPIISTQGSSTRFGQLWNRKWRRFPGFA